MAPLPCSRIWRSSYFMQFQTPRRLIAVHPVEFFAADIGHFNGRTTVSPALLNAASRRPKADTVCSTIAATSASSATSQRMANRLVSGGRRVLLLQSEPHSR